MGRCSLKCISDYFRYFWCWSHQAVLFVPVYRSVLTDYGHALAHVTVLWGMMTHYWMQLNWTKWFKTLLFEAGSEPATSAWGQDRGVINAIITGLNSTNPTYNRGYSPVTNWDEPPSIGSNWIIWIHNCTMLHWRTLASKTPDHAWPAELLLSSCCCVSLLFFPTWDGTWRCDFNGISSVALRRVPWDAWVGEVWYNLVHIGLWMLDLPFEPK